MNSSDDDSQQRFALGFLFALIALILCTVVGAVVVQRLGAATQPAPARATAVAAGSAPVSAPADTAGSDVASVRVDNGVVKFYFASGKADLAAGANEALAEVVKGTGEGRTALVSGFHDTTGNPEQNAELAKQRAVAVRDALRALGVAEQKIELKKPEETTASGNGAEARRVEVVLSAQ